MDKSDQSRWELYRPPGSYGSIGIQVGTRCDIVRLFSSWRRMRYSATGISTAAGKNFHFSHEIDIV